MLGKVDIHLPAQPRQGAAEGAQTLILALVADGAPIGGVAVLLAPALVAAGRLDVAARIGADPDVRPGRRDDQPGDAIEGLGVAHRLAGRVAVSELAAPG